MKKIPAGAADSGRVRAAVRDAWNDHGNEWDGLWDCAFCIYYFKENDKSGQCRRYAPRAALLPFAEDIPLPYTHWPEVGPGHESWCGEFTYKGERK